MTADFGSPEAALGGEEGGRAPKRQLTGKPVVIGSARGVPWRRVYVFISSTFNDMHAERDYLVKRVFPELQEWCERSKLQLIDVDLRWGITEQDAHNLASVKVCLEHIDRCRPFFVCLLGQRRGWVPRARDVSGDTLDTFPELAGEIGRRSVTELEILHAVVRPFRRRESSAAGALGAAPEIARHAFFYLRDPSYLAQLGRDSGGAQQIYTNESLSTPEERASADEAVREWREEQIPAVRRPLRLYRSSWDDRGTTPELRLPLAAPSAGSAAQWRERWLAAGVGVPCDAVAVPESLQDAAADSNRRLCRGRLKDFRFIGHLEEPPRHCDPPGAVLPAESSLAEVIVEDLKLAICERFRHEPARFRSGVELAAVDELERELEQQEQFLFDHAQGFVERAGDFDELDEYLGRPNEPRVLVLAGEDGIGKSTLLARWIQRHQDEATRSSLRLQYRFIGASDLSASVDALIRSLWRELTEGDGKLRQEIPEDAQELRKAWPELLAEAGRRRPTALVIDALNQLDTGMGDLSWLPERLPEDVRLVVSCPEPWRGAADLTVRARPFGDADDRRRLVSAYLGQYLKQLDESAVEVLIGLPGAVSPLFLKVALSELQLFGSHANLADQITRAFGTTPATAFAGVLQRLENEAWYTALDPRAVVALLFGFLAHARGGLSRRELTDLITRHYPWPAGVGADGRDGEVRDAVNFYLRQVRPFLARRLGRDDLFYESFRLAALERYQCEPSPSLPMCRPAYQWHRWLAASYWRQTKQVGEVLEPFYDVHLAFDVESALHDSWLNSLMQSQLELLAADSGVTDATSPLPVDPIQLAVRLHETFGRILGIDVEATGAIIEALRRDGSCVVARLPRDRAEALALRFAAAGMPVDMKPVEAQPPSSWPSTEPRHYRELVHHQIEGRLWEPHAEALSSEEFRQRCTAFFGPRFYIEHFKNFVKLASSDEEVGRLLNMLRLKLPINDHTRPLMRELADGLDDDPEQAAALLTACARDPSQHGRAVIALRAIESAAKHQRARSEAASAAIARAVQPLVASADKRTRWETVHAYWSLVSRGETDPLLCMAESESEHPLIRAEAARQLGEADDPALIPRLARLANSRLYPLRATAARSARRIRSSLRLEDGGPIDDWTQPEAMPADLRPVLRALGIEPSSVDLSRWEEQPAVLFHVVGCSTMSVEARWREVETLETIFRMLPCQLICSESGSADCSLTTIKALASPEVWQHVALRFFHDLQLNAEEYLQLATGFPFSLQGVDDPTIFSRGIAEKWEGKRGLEFAASVSRAQTMLSGTLTHLRSRVPRVAVLMTQELPGYQIARLLGEERQFNRQMAEEAGLSPGMLGTYSIFESLLPDRVPPHMVAPQPDLLYVLLRMREPHGDLFDMDINYVHSI